MAQYPPEKPPWDEWQPIGWKQQEAVPIKKSYRRLLFALAASGAVHVVAIVTGLGDAVVLPTALLLYDVVPLGHDLESLLIVLVSSVLLYAILFWTIGTIWKILTERGVSSRTLTK